MGFNSAFEGLNAKLNPICHLLALFGVHLILHVSRMRVNIVTFDHMIAETLGIPFKLRGLTSHRANCVSVIKTNRLVIT